MGNTVNIYCYKNHFVAIKWIKPPWWHCKFCIVTFSQVWMQWRIWGWREARVPPRGSKFFKFHAVFGEIWQNRMLASPCRVGAPTSGKSWICHWNGCDQVQGILSWDWNALSETSGSTCTHINCMEWLMVIAGSVDPEKQWSVITYRSDLAVKYLTIWLL